MPRRLLVLFFVLFIAMIGFGVTLPALPFFVERLSLGEGASEQTVALHVGALTSVYALMQVVSAPAWGWWSDRHGRKPLLVLGLGGFALAQGIFGMGTSLPLLYAARLVGGVFSGGLLTAAAAYIADTCSGAARGQAMAWQGTALSLGVVAGPILSGMLARQEWHVTVGARHLLFDGFSIPFFAAAGLGLLTLPLVIARLPESVRRERHVARQSVTWKALNRMLGPVMVLVFLSQAALALFEAVFALYARWNLNLTLGEIGAGFAVCGGVMALFQGGLTGYLSGRVAPWHQVALGFGLLGAGIGLLLVVQSLPFVLTAIGVLAIGVALNTPNLLTLAANRSGEQVGIGLGLQRAFASLGQAAGPFVGGVLYGWQADLPFQVTAVGSLLVAGTVWYVARSRLRQMA